VKKKSEKNVKKCGKMCGAVKWRAFNARFVAVVVESEKNVKKCGKMCGAVKWRAFNARFVAVVVVVAISKADLHYNLLQCLHTLCPCVFPPLSHFPRRTFLLWLISMPGR